MAIGALAIVIASILSWYELRRELRHAPRWVLPTVIGAAFAVLMAFVLVSVVADRAVSIHRSLTTDVEQDMRSRAFPTVLNMTRAVFPMGIGLGSFDPAFRIQEPLSLLKPTYFNQAHNDIVEIVLDTGISGLVLLFTAFAWWFWASIRVWRNLGKRQFLMPRLGSATTLLVFIGSVFDYPARTPLIMAVLVLAGVWLSSHSDGDEGTALPPSDHHL